LRAPSIFDRKQLLQGTPGLIATELVYNLAYHNLLIVTMAVMQKMLFISIKNINIKTVQFENFQNTVQPLLALYKVSSCLTTEGIIAQMSYTAGFQKWKS
jgi:hypothetical protein